MANINRLVWANGFTNDKRAYCNKEPYKKPCKRCKQVIWMTPTQNGWRALESTGEPHRCAKLTKTKKRIRKYMKNCNQCSQKIEMVQKKGKWRAQDPDGKRHRCPDGGFNSKIKMEQY